MIIPSRALLPILRAALVVFAFGIAACHGELSEPVPTRRGAKVSGAGGKRTEVAELPLDCDDLPALTPEELARPPREVRLERAARAAPLASMGYTTLPDVTLSDEVSAKLSRIDDLFARRAGEHLVITSGKRDAATQAKAMHKMLELGVDILRLYKNHRAAREIQVAYEATRRKPPEVTGGAIYEVIKGQMARGVYISAHLRAGAVDVRSRTMSTSARQAFMKVVAEVGGVTLLEEAKPPHYHLQME